jgi:hypothetical protein
VLSVNLRSFLRGPRFEPEIEMKPQAVGVRHEEQRKRDGEQEPEGQATVVGDAFQVGQKEGHKKNRNDDHEREAIGDDHATNVVTRLAEEGKAAVRTRRTNFVRPASEHASLLAVGTTQPERGTKGSAKGRACFLRLGQSGLQQCTPTRENTGKHVALVRCPAYGQRRSRRPIPSRSLGRVGL